MADPLQGRVHRSAIDRGDDLRTQGSLFEAGLMLPVFVIAALSVCVCG